MRLCGGITIERRGFENGTAFSAVAPSWRLVALRLSIVRGLITRASRYGFYRDVMSADAPVRRRSVMTAPQSDAPKFQRVSKQAAVGCGRAVGDDLDCASCGIDTASLTELMDKFQDVAGVCSSPRGQAQSCKYDGPRAFCCGWGRPSDIETDGSAPC